MRRNSRANTRPTGREHTIFSGCPACSGVRPPAGQRATVDLIADRLAAGETVKAIVDRTVSPSYVPDIVSATMALARSGERRLVSITAWLRGATTWYELAGEIARLNPGSRTIVPLNAGRISDRIAPRPRFCALSNAKLADLGHQHAGLEERSPGALVSSCSSQSTPKAILPCVSGAPDAVGSRPANLSRPADRPSPSAHV